MIINHNHDQLYRFTSTVYITINDQALWKEPYRPPFPRFAVTEPRHTARSTASAGFLARFASR